MLQARICWRECAERPQKQVCAGTWFHVIIASSLEASIQTLFVTAGEDEAEDEHNAISEQLHQQNMQVIVSSEGMCMALRI